MDLNAGPFVIELPRPFLLACLVSLVAHAGVAGWYRPGAETRAVQAPRAALLVKVSSLRLKQAPAPAPVKPPPAVVRPEPPKPVTSHASTDVVSRRQVHTRVPPESPRRPLPQPLSDVPPEPADTVSQVVVPAGSPGDTLPDPDPEPVQVPAFVPPSSDAETLDNPKPGYPRVALRRGIEGLVLLRVDVDARGRPLAVRVKKSAGFRPLDIAALRAVRRWRFVPAQRNGVAVRASVDVPVRFRLEDGA